MNNSEIGEFIRRKRRELKMSQEDLGDKVGVTRETVSAWENARFKDIKEESCEKLADALGVKVCELRAGKELPGLMEDDKERLDQVIKDLCDVQVQTDRAEDTGLLSTEIGFYAYGLATSALALGWMANFPNSEILPFICYPLCIFGFLFMFLGKRAVDGIRKKRNKKETPNDGSR